MLPRRVGSGAGHDVVLLCKFDRMKPAGKTVMIIDVAIVPGESMAPLDVVTEKKATMPVNSTLGNRSPLKDSPRWRKRSPLKESPCYVALYLYRSVDPSLRRFFALSLCPSVAPLLCRHIQRRHALARHDYHVDHHHRLPFLFHWIEFTNQR